MPEKVSDEKNSHLADWEVRTEPLVMDVEVPELDKILYKEQYLSLPTDEIIPEEELPTVVTRSEEI